MRTERRFEALVVVATACLLPTLLGAKGCIFGGEVVLGENDGGASSGGHSAAGAANPRGAATSTGGKSNTGGSSTGGASTTSSGGADNSGGESGASDALPMTDDDVVSPALRAWNIHARWYWFSDQTDETEGGFTSFEGVSEGVAPFIPGKGMCVRGTTGAGMADQYATWGGGIGVNLNYDAVTDRALPLRDPPRCFTILISAGATYPGEFRAEPLGKVPPGGQPLFWPIHAGVNDVCLDRVQVSTYCSAESSCLGRESLTDGVATLNITAASAAFQGGAIDFCVEAVIPHD